MNAVEEKSFGPFDAEKNEEEEEEKDDCSDDEQQQSPIATEHDSDVETNKTPEKNHVENRESEVMTDAYYLITDLEKEIDNSIETIGESENTNENENDVGVIENINSVEEHSKEPWQYNLESPEQCLLALISTSKLSDLTIFIKDCDEPYKVHRLILCMRSPFWEKKLYLDKFEDDTITLTEEQPLPFKHVLTYMYTGKVKFPDVQVAIAVYHLAHKYQMGNLMDQCSQYLMIYITTSNVPEVFKTATLLGDTQLLHKCIQIMEVSPDAVFTAPTFIAMCRESVASLVEQELTVSSEIIVFQALLKWGRSRLESNKEEITPKNLRMEIQDFLPKVRFLTMSLIEFVTHVMPTEVLSLDEMKLIQLNIVKASSELPEICSSKREKRKNVSDTVTNKKAKNDICKVSPGVSQQNNITKSSSQQVSNQKAISQASKPIADQVSRLSGQAFMQQISNRVQATLATVTSAQQTQVPNLGRPVISHSTMASRMQQVQQHGGGSMASRIQQVQQTWTPAGNLTTLNQSASMLRAAPTGAVYIRTPLGPRLYAMPHNK